MLLPIVVIVLVGGFLIGYYAASFGGGGGKAVKSQAPSSAAEETASESSSVLNPGGKYADFEALGTAAGYRFSGTLVGIDNKSVTLKTSERFLQVKKPESTIYFEVRNNRREQISEAQLRQNEPAVMVVSVDKSTDTISSLSITVKRP